MTEPAKHPVGFVSHGAPTLALDAERGADLARWGRSLGRPRAVLVVSAHWQRTPATVGTTRRRPLLYDFHGFDPALHRVRYDAPAATDLAREVEDLVGAHRDDERAWDHGVWVPLLHMFPAADVPVLQLSLPSAVPAHDIVDLGRRLQPLRRSDVLVLASGGMVHNLARLDWSERSPAPAWAAEFEAWARERLAAGAVDDLAAFRERAPALALAHPTHEHFLPLLVAVGAADGYRRVEYPVEGFEYGSLSRLSLTLS